MMKEKKKKIIRFVLFKMINFSLSVKKNEQQQKESHQIFRPIRDE